MDHDVDVEINHDVYMNAVDFDAAEEAGWNGTGVPPGGKFWFKVHNLCFNNLRRKIMIYISNQKKNSIKYRYMYIYVYIYAYSFYVG